MLAAAAMLARRFLWLIVIAIVALLGAAVAYRLFGDRLLTAATTPRVAFEQARQSPPPDYARTDAWIARPGRPNDPGLFAPPGFRPAPRPAAAVFYVAPTAYVQADRWNAPADDPAQLARLRRYAASQASIGNGVAAVWAPVYRQAVFGAFLSPDAASRAKALDLAYSDVRRAWDAFLAANPQGPVILIGHSQGALHLGRLLSETAARDPALRQRIVAAYLPGWPWSLTADVPAMGLPPCDGPDQTGCVLSWQSFAEPANPAAILTAYNLTPGLGGRPRAGTPMLCVNPIRGFRTEAGAVAAANLGALMPNPDDEAHPTLTSGAAGARCQGGFLRIGAPPKGFDRFVLPGNNYHVYDVALFWANLRADVERRTNGWVAARMAARTTGAVPTGR